MAQKKSYQYKAEVVDDRGHLDDPEFLAMLNKEGAEGWKHKEDQPKGSRQLVVLLEREVLVDDDK
jgi:hypothetical protein